MGEKELVINHIKEHPEIIKHQCIINTAITCIKEEIFNDILSAIKSEFGVVKENLFTSRKSSGFQIKIRDSQYNELPFCIYYVYNSAIMIGVHKDFAEEPIKKSFESMCSELKDVSEKIKTKKFDGGYDEYWCLGTFHFYKDDVFAKDFSPYLQDKDKLKIQISDLMQKVRKYILRKSQKAGIPAGEKRRGIKAILFN